MENEIKFFFNGFKINKGKLNRARFYLTQRFTGPGGKLEDQIVMYAKDYQRFEAATMEFFEVKNNSDSMTDYFEEDSFEFGAGHPLFSQVAEVLIKNLVRDVKRFTKRGSTRPATEAENQIQRVRGLVAGVA